MSKEYKSKSFEEFVSSSKEYQTPKKMSDKNIEPKTGKMEKFLDDTKTNSNIMSKAKSATEYDPKAIAFSDFTSNKKAEKMQSMVKKNTADGSSTAKGEKPGLETMPNAKKTKSFDIDVTEYKPKYLSKK